MKLLAHWAKANLALARLTIVLSHLLLIGLALFLGGLLFQINLGDTPRLIFLFGNIFFLAFFFYPRKGDKNGWWRYSFWRQKRHDFLLLFSCFWVVALGTNNFLVNLEDGPAYVAQTEETAIENISKVSFAFYHPATEAKEKAPAKSRKKARQERKAKKRQFKQQLREWKQQLREEGKRNGVVVSGLLILLTIVGALALAYLVAAIACSIACSGMDFLAVVVFILGIIGVIWLSVITFKAIRHGKRRRAAESTDPGAAVA